AKAKWEQWNGLKGKDAATARAEYIALVETLSAKYN
ncbi:hypothetical protein KIPB_006959, partial [Kipferlia bialata]